MGNLQSRFPALTSPLRPSPHLAAKSPEARKENARKAAESRRRNREAAKGEAPG